MVRVQKVEARAEYGLLSISFRAARGQKEFSTKMRHKYEVSEVGVHSTFHLQHI